MDLAFAWKIFDEACEDNKNRESKIQQGLAGEKRHAKEVLDWVIKIDPHPSLELQLAAIFHDIDRVVTPEVGSGFKGDRKSLEYLKHKKDHAKRSTDYISKRFFGAQGINLERLRFLIEHHEASKDELESLSDHEISTLVAADTLAWFTTTGPILVRVEGAERARDKFQFMMGKLPNFAYKYLAGLKLKDKIVSDLVKKN